MAICRDVRGVSRSQFAVMHGGFQGGPLILSDGCRLIAVRLLVATAVQRTASLGGYKRRGALSTAPVATELSTHTHTHSQGGYAGTAVKYSVCLC